MSTCGWALEVCGGNGEAVVHFTFTKLHDLLLIHLFLGYCSQGGGKVEFPFLPHRMVDGKLSTDFQFHPYSLFHPHSLKTLPLFAYHPILMVASWLFFAPLSWSLILVRGRTLVKSKRVILTQLHAASMFLAVVCWGLALGSIFVHKQKLEKEHFQSPHSMMGASVFVLIVSSYMSALYNVVDSKSKEKVGTRGGVSTRRFPLLILCFCSQHTYTNRCFPYIYGLNSRQVNFNWTSKIHKNIGKVALCMTGLAISTGLFTRWGKTTFEDKNIRTGLALCIIVPQLIVALDVMTRSAGKEDKRKAK